MPAAVAMAPAGGCARTRTRGVGSSSYPLCYVPDDVRMAAGSMQRAVKHAHLRPWTCHDVAAKSRCQVPARVSGTLQEIHTRSSGIAEQWRGATQRRRGLPFRPRKSAVWGKPFLLCTARLQGVLHVARRSLSTPLSSTIVQHVRTSS